MPGGSGGAAAGTEEKASQRAAFEPWIWSGGDGAASDYDVARSAARAALRSTVSSALVRGLNGEVAAGAGLALGAQFLDLSLGQQDWRGRRRCRRRRPCGPGRERLLGLERGRDLEPLGRAAHAADGPKLVLARLKPPQESLLPPPSLSALVEYAGGPYGNDRGLLLPQCATRRGKGCGSGNEDSDSASDVEHTPSYCKRAAEGTPVPSGYFSPERDGAVLQACGEGQRCRGEGRVCVPDQVGALRPLAQPHDALLSIGTTQPQLGGFSRQEHRRRELGA